MKYTIMPLILIAIIGIASIAFVVDTKKQNTKLVQANLTQIKDIPECTGCQEFDRNEVKEYSINKETITQKAESIQKEQEGATGIRGIVLDANSNPCPNTIVSSWMRPNNQDMTIILKPRPTKTDEYGQYEIKPAPLGIVHLSATKKNTGSIEYGTITIQTDKNNIVEAQPIIIGQPYNTTHITGTVKLENGTPVPGAKIYAVFSSTPVPGIGVQTNAKGEFTIKGLSMLSESQVLEYRIMCENLDEILIWHNMIRPNAKVVRLFPHPQTHHLEQNPGHSHIANFILRNKK